MNPSGIIGVIVSGLVIGALGRLLVPGRPRIGCAMTLLLGVVGGVIGYYLGHDLADRGKWLTFLIQIVVAAFLVGTFGLFARSSSRSPHR
jgi:uncharacterized membrane protein YeaQ/YmgE (transglycosylase-associated protein family)